MSQNGPLSQFIQRNLPGAAKPKKAAPPRMTPTAADYLLGRAQVPQPPAQNPNPIADQQRQNAQTVRRMSPGIDRVANPSNERRIQIRANTPGTPENTRELVRRQVATLPIPDEKRAEIEALVDSALFIRTTYIDPETNMRRRVSPLASQNAIRQTGLLDPSDAMEVVELLKTEGGVRLLQTEVKQFQDQRARGRSQARELEALARPGNVDPNIAGVGGVIDALKPVALGVPSELMSRAIQNDPANIAGVVGVGEAAVSSFADAGLAQFRNAVQPLRMLGVDPEAIERGIRQFGQAQVRGFAGGVSSMTRIPQLLGSREWADFSDAIDKGVAMREADKPLDQTFFNEIARTVGGVVPQIAPALLTGGSSIGASVAGRMVASAVFATTEAMSNAASGFDRAVKEGQNIEEARQRSARALPVDMIVSAALNRFGEFSDISPLWKKMFASSFSEGVQEWVQTGLEGYVATGELDLSSPEAIKGMALGAALGPWFSAGIDLATGTQMEGGAEAVPQRSAAASVPPVAEDYRGAEERQRAREEQYRAWEVRQKELEELLKRASGDTMLPNGMPNPMSKAAIQKMINEHRKNRPAFFEIGGSQPSAQPANQQRTEPTQMPTREQLAAMNVGAEVGQVPNVNALRPLQSEIDEQAAFRRSLGLESDPIQQFAPQSQPQPVVTPTPAPQPSGTRVESAVVETNLQDPQARAKAISESPIPKATEAAWSSGNEKVVVGVERIQEAVSRVASSSDPKDKDVVRLLTTMHTVRARAEAAGVDIDPAGELKRIEAQMRDLGYEVDPGFMDAGDAYTTNHKAEVLDHIQAEGELRVHEQIVPSVWKDGRLIAPPKIITTGYSENWRSPEDDGGNAAQLPPPPDSTLPPTATTPDFPRTAPADMPRPQEAPQAQAPAESNREIAPENFWEEVAKAYNNPGIRAGRGYLGGLEIRQGKRWVALGLPDSWASAREVGVQPPAGYDEWVRAQMKKDDVIREANEKAAREKSRQEDIKLATRDEDFRVRLVRVLESGVTEDGKPLTAKMRRDVEKDIARLEQSLALYAKMGIKPAKQDAPEATQPQHFIFVRRGDKMFPIGGPYATREDAEADKTRVMQWAENIDPAIAFEQLFGQEVKDPKVIKAYTDRLKKVGFPFNAAQQPQPQQRTEPTQMPTREQLAAMNVQPPANVPDVPSLRKVAEGVGQDATKKEPWQMTREEYLASTPGTKEDAAILQQAKRVVQTLEKAGWDMSRGAQIPASGWRQIAKKARIANEYVFRTPNAQGIRVIDLSNGMVGVTVTGTIAEKQHSAAVYDALKDGLPVPPEVLADYPDLAAKYQPQNTPAKAPVASSDKPIALRTVTDNASQHGFSFEPGRVANKRNDSAITIGNTTYPTLVSTEGGTKIALSSTEIYVHKIGGGREVLEGDPASPMQDAVTIAAIVTPQGARGKGGATKAIQNLTTLADKYNVRLLAEPVQMTQFGGDNTLSRGQLVEWYKRNGFTEQSPGVDLILVREPNPQPAPQNTPAKPQPVAQPANVPDAPSLRKVAEGVGDATKKANADLQRKVQNSGKPTRQDVIALQREYASRGYGLAQNSKGEYLITKTKGGVASSTPGQARIGLLRMFSFDAVRNVDAVIAEFESYEAEAKADEALVEYAKNKQPHELTYAEIEQFRKVSPAGEALEKAMLEKHFYSLPAEQRRAVMNSDEWPGQYSHRMAVEEAYGSGLAVPSNVLEEYGMAGAPRSAYKRTDASARGVTPPPAPKVTEPTPQPKPVAVQPGVFPISNARPVQKRGHIVALYPSRVGGKFSPTDIEAVKEWAQSEGATVAASPTVITVTGPLGKDWAATAVKAVESVRGLTIRQARNKAAVDQYNQQKEAKDAANKAYIAAHPNEAAWLVNVFGEGFANDYNQASLIRYLVGDAKQFDGGMTPSWVPGLAKLGLSRDNASDMKRSDIAAVIKKAWEAQPQNTPAKAPGSVSPGVQQAEGSTAGAAEPPAQKPTDTAEALGVVLRSAGYNERQVRGLMAALNPVIEQNPGAVVRAVERIDPSGKLLQEFAAPFYSKLERVAREKLPARASAEQIKKTLLAAGVKPEEMQWTGIDALLSSGGMLSKQDILDHIQVNQIRVEDVVKGGRVAPPQEYIDAYDDLIDERDRGGRISAREWERKVGELNEKFGYPKDASPYALTSRGAAPTEFQVFKMPGGENYRELLLTLPVDVSGASPMFVSEHWDEPNVLAHIRFDERTDANGNKVLHVAEIQSDWHQEGRKQGYKGGGNSARVATTAAQMGGYWEVRDQQGGFITNVMASDLRNPSSQAAIEEAQRRIASQESGRVAADKRVPDAPFKKTWHELSMKRILRYAAENGFDSVSWDTGATNVKRFNPSKPEGMVAFYDSILPDTANKIAKRFGAKVEGGTVEGFDGFTTLTAPTHLLRMTPAMKSALLNEGQPLFQTGQDGVKGAYTPVSRMVELVIGKADISTVVHEFAHDWHGFLQDHPTHGPVIRRAYGTVENVEGAEQFARDFEKFLASGKSPAKSLQSVFDAFKRWMADIYGQVFGRNIPKDVKAIFRDAYANPSAETLRLVREFESYAPAPKQAKKPKPQAPAPVEAVSKIEDVGEKVGGARKDLAATREAGRKERKKGEARFVIVPPDARSSKFTVVDRQARFNSIIGEASTQAEAETIVKIGIFSQRHGFSNTADRGYVIYRKVGERRVVLKSGFESKEAAQQYAVKNIDEVLGIKTSFGESDLVTTARVTRTGPKRRSGNVTAKQLKDTFGLRAVEFGNWNNQSERQAVVNEAYDALADLASLMGVDPAFVGLGGNLSLAFGARGRGLSSSRAHFEPERVVINLTKENGFGALAHEWFHAFDQYLLHHKNYPWQGDVVSGVRPGVANFASEAVSGGAKTLPQEVLDAIKGLRQTIKVKTVSDPEAQKRAKAAIESRKNELVAKAEDVKRFILTPGYSERKGGSKITDADRARLDEIVALISTGAHPVERQALQSNSSSPLRAMTVSKAVYTNDLIDELSELSKKATGQKQLYADNQGVIGGLGSAQRSYDLAIERERTTTADATRETPTEFLKNAREIDRGRTTSYWSEPRELFARAFQAYVADRSGESNSYLDYGSRNEFYKAKYLPWADDQARPYPEGEERTQIVNAVERLIQAVAADQPRQAPDILASPSKPAKAKDTITVDGKERPRTNSNGKPIHPTEEGIRAFWKWFGDSKIVDEQGRPLVVYHGGPRGITRFIPSFAKTNGDMFGEASYFTSSRQEAAQYAKEGEVYEVYLRGDILDLSQSVLPRVAQSRLTDMAARLMKPYDKARFPQGRKVKTFQSVEDALAFYDQQTQEFNTKGGGLRVAEPQADMVDGAPSVSYTDFDATIAITTGDDAMTLLKAIGFNNVLAAKFDGVILDVGGNATWFVMHDPERNVKSATGNQGTFSPDSPSILASPSRVRRGVPPQQASETVPTAVPSLTPAKPKQTPDPRAEARAEAKRGGHLPEIEGWSVPEPKAPAGDLNVIRMALDRVFPRHTYGRNRKGTKGTFNLRTGFTMVGYVSDSVTRVHELAHQLEGVYNVLDGIDADTLSLIDAELSSEAFGQTVPENASAEVERSERFAEWLTAYIEEPAGAAMLAPTVLKVMVERVPAQARAAIDEFSSQVQGYRNLPPEKQMALRIEDPSARKTFVETLRGWFSQASQAIGADGAAPDMAVHRTRVVDGVWRAAVTNTRAPIEGAVLRLAEMQGFTVEGNAVIGMSATPDDDLLNSPLHYIAAYPYLVEMTKAMLEGGLKNLRNETYTHNGEPLSVVSLLNSLAPGNARAEQLKSAYAYMFVQRFESLKGRWTADEQAALEERQAARVAKSDANRARKERQLTTEMNYALSDMAKAGKTERQIASERKRREAEIAKELDALDVKRAKKLASDLKRDYTNTQQVLRKRLENMGLTPGETLEQIEAAQKAIMADFDAKPEAWKKEVRSFAAQYRALGDASLDVLVGGGVLSQQEADEVRRNNPYWISARRVKTSSMPGLRDSDRDSLSESGASQFFQKNALTGTDDGINQFKGSQANIQDPVASLMQNIFEAYRAAYINKSIGGIVALAEGAGPGAGMFDDITDTVRADRTVSNFAPGETVRVYRQVPVKNAKGEIVRDEMGEPVIKTKEFRYVVLDPSMQRAFRGASRQFGMPDYPALDTAIRVLSLPKRALQWGVVVTPMFKLFNVMRDTAERVVGGRHDRTFYKVFTTRPLNEYEYRSMGIGIERGGILGDRNDYQNMMTSVMRNLTPKNTMLVKAGAPFRAFHNMYFGKFSVWSESVNRTITYNAAFKKAKERGMSDPVAALWAAGEARSAGTDFARHGAVTAFFDTFIPFLNPAVQGQATFWTNAAKNPKRFMARLIMYALIGAGLEELWALTDGTSAARRDLPAYQRYMFWNFHIKDDKWLRIPKGHELGAILALGEEARRGAAGEEMNLPGVGRSMFQTMSPVSESDIYGPLTTLIQWNANRDFFTGNSIVPEWESKRAMELRDFENSSPMAKLLARITNKDARLWDMAINETFGTVGAIATDASRLAGPDELPMSDRLAGLGGRVFGVVSRQSHTQAPAVVEVRSIMDRIGSQDVMRPYRDAYHASTSASERERVGRLMIEEAERILPRLRRITSRVPRNEAQLKALREQVSVVRAEVKSVAELRFGTPAR